ncbi:hypothetical protein KCP74_08280 [Salmonella enterica subsp. enterica]|nr:hypothetical protein KCP74_08280 [Salmonella enterica subsp. enterica]
MNPAFYSEDSDAPCGAIPLSSPQGQNGRSFVQAHRGALGVMADRYYLA